MSINIAAAEQFIYANARLLDRHRLATLLHAAPIEPVVDSLRGYRNPDGGFGHALEPDVRCPASQPTATLQALEVLTEAGASDHPMVTDAAEWIATIANSGGGVPTVLPTAADHPHAPFMVPSTDSGFLTYALAAPLWHAGLEHRWLDAATSWCWAQLEGPDQVGGYAVKFALEFLDAVPDPPRAATAIARLGAEIAPDGTIPVTGGIEGEKLRPLDLSPSPGTPSRALFSEEQIDADLDRLEQDQLEDGGWDFNFLHWSPGQSVEWRGTITVAALQTLAAHGRIDVPQAA